MGNAWHTDEHISQRAPKALGLDEPFENSAATPSSAADPAAGSAKLTVLVPENAVVFINGKPTKSTGAYREYISLGLERGRTYTYHVCAQVIRDGKTIKDVREVVLFSGNSKGMVLDFSGRKNVELISAL